MQVTMPSDIETNVENDVAATPVRCGGLIDLEERLQNGELGGASSWEDIENKPSTFPPSTHSHDDLYYTESEVNNLLNSKLDSNGNASNLVSTFTQAINFENLTSGESLSVSLGKIMKAIEVIDSKADKIAVYSEDASQIVKEIDLGFKMLEEEGNVTKGQLIDRDTMGALYPETTWERIIDKPSLEIGGRNLIQNSTGNLNSFYSWNGVGSSILSVVPNGGVNNLPYFHFHFDMTSATSRKAIRNISFPTDYAVGDTFTISGYIRVNEPNDATLQIGIRFNAEGSLWCPNIGPKVFEANGEWQYFSATDTIPFYVEPTENHPNFHIAVTQGSVIDFDWCAIKVEKGNKATDWTPAIEDIDTKLNTKANTSHTHAVSQITDFPTSLKNPNAMVVQLNGGTTENTDYFTYDGSTAKTISITANGVGAYTKSEVDNLIDSVDVPMDSILNTVYPVGSIYTSVNSTDPSTLFGGTWERFGKGKVLVGVDEDDSDFSEANKTGGEKTHTLTTNEMPSHTHTQNSHTHTIGSHTHSVPAHSHGLNSHTHSFSDTSSSAGSHTHSVSGTAASNGSHSHNHSYDLDAAAGGARYSVHRAYGGGYGNNATTSSNGAHTHSVSGTAASAGGHTHTVSGTTGAASGSTANSSSLTSGSTAPSCSSATATNQSTGGGGSHNNLQPFITVFMWVRTA